MFAIMASPLFSMLMVLWFSGIDLASSLSIDPTEYQILADLYAATDGENWVYDPNYGVAGYPWFTASNPDPCYNHWQGILCLTFKDCDNDCHLFSLQITGFGLDGSLPPNMFNFSELFFMKITENPLLTGGVPSAFDMPTIQTFNLSYNALTGPIPSFAPAYSPLLELLYLSLE